MNAVQKLREVTDTIRTPTDGVKIVDAWTLAGRLLGRMPVDQSEAARVLKEKDADGLDALVRSLENPAAAKPPADAATPDEPGPAISEETLRAAMKAYRKRLKLGRLADESRLTGHKLTKGEASHIDAIIPPTDFPPPVWRELARRGLLEHTGGGFYGLGPKA